MYMSKKTIYPHLVKLMIITDTVVDESIEIEYLEQPHDRVYAVYDPTPLIYIHIMNVIMIVNHRMNKLLPRRNPRHIREADDNVMYMADGEIWPKRKRMEEIRGGMVVVEERRETWPNNLMNSMVDCYKNI